MRTRVYISGPMTKGDRIANLAAGLEVYRTLIDAGYSPLCPHLTFFVGDILPQPHGVWLAIDLPWVAVSHAVLRLPGESVGGDMETAAAEKYGVPVFRSLDDLLAAIPAIQPDVVHERCPHTAIHETS